MAGENKEELICVAIQRLIDEKIGKRSSGDGFIAGDEVDQLSLSRLLSQLDSLKEDGPIKQTKPLAEHEELVKAEDNEKRGEGSTAMGKAEEIIKELRKLESLKEDSSITQTKPPSEREELVKVEENEKTGNDSISKANADEIAKELGKLKRQNTTTHWLLSIMILLTVTWQLSEVSILLKVRNKVNHPFKSIASLLSGILKGPVTNNGQDEQNKQSSSNPIHVEAPSIPSLKLPEAPTIPGLKMPELPLVDLQVFNSNFQER